MFLLQCNYQYYHLAVYMYVHDAGVELVSIISLSGYHLYLQVVIDTFRHSLMEVILLLQDYHLHCMDHCGHIMDGTVQLYQKLIK